MLNRLSTPIQIGISVANVRLAAAALSRILAIDEWRFSTWSANRDPATISTHRGTPNPDWKGELAFTTLGAIEIELIEDISGRSAYQEFVSRSGFGLRHIMFQVQDIGAALSLAAKEGLQVSTQTATLDGNVTWAVLDTSDRFGFDIEVKQKTA